MKNNHPRLSASLERLKRFQAESETCDAAIRAQRLAAWKEEIIGDCVDVLKALDDPEPISNIDRAIALSADVHSL